MKAMFHRFKEFVEKDTIAQNEPIKTTLIVRLLLLSYVFYYLVNIILCTFMYQYFETMPLFVCLLIACAIMFAMTYRVRTQITLWGFTIGTLICSVVYVHFLGWNTGVQHFLMLLVVLYFFSEYKHYPEKVLYAVGMVMIRLIMFNVYYQRTPEFILLAAENRALQTLNTIMVFWGLSLVCMICSDSSQEMEGKLLEYNTLLEKQATEDLLTGLFNRRKGKELLDAIAKNQSMAGNCCVSIGDIDYFKKVNDTYGHDAGDEVLRVVSRILESEMRRKDFVVRWGGEEFLLVFMNCNGDEACEILDHIRKKIKNTEIIVNDQKIKVTMTFGLTEFFIYDGVDETIKAADEKLYQGKQAGRNRIIY